MNTTLEQLDEFTHAYLLCALWTWDDNAPSGEYSTSGRPEELFPRFSEQALERAKADCVKFQSEDKDLLADAILCADYSIARAGHDFWLTRNGHGSGFWDREQLPDDLGEALTKHAHVFRECDLYEGDDGKLYFA